jgi:hypothetical protein
MARKPKKKEITHPDLVPHNLKASDLTVVETPIYSASGIQILSTGNEFMLLLGRARAAKLADGQLAPVAIQEPVATIYVSPQTLKDLHVALGDVLREHEKLFGNISTPFLKQRASRAN